MNKINIKNKKAYHEYEILEKYTSGIQLTGTEIKSIRLGKVSLSESFCIFEVNELWVIGMHIEEYAHGTYFNHAPKQSRKLLLNRRELNKLEGKTQSKGLTIIPLRIYIAENGYAKLEIALAKGKKTFDKRENLKEKDVKRDLDRIYKR